MKDVVIVKSERWDESGVNCEIPGISTDVPSYTERGSRPTPQSLPRVLASVEMKSARSLQIHSLVNMHSFLSETLKYSIQVLDGETRSAVIDA